LRIFIDEMGRAVRANPIRDAAESKAALAGRMQKFAARSFVAMLLEFEHIFLSYAEAALMSASGT
jgi:hypothetical protein